MSARSGRHNYVQWGMMNEFCDQAGVASAAHWVRNDIRSRRTTAVGRTFTLVLAVGLSTGACVPQYYAAPVVAPVVTAEAPPSVSPALQPPPSQYGPPPPEIRRGKPLLEDLGPLNEQGSGDGRRR
jgi:hypothetical protein